MKSKRIYANAARAAERVYMTLFQTLQDSYREAREDDIISLDYMDVQAIIRVLEYEHDHSPESVRIRSQHVYDMIMSAIREDYERGAMGDVRLARYEISEVLATLEVFYLISGVVPLETRYHKSVFLEYYVQDETEYVRISTPDGYVETIMFDECFHSEWWLIIYQDIKDHEGKAPFNLDRDKYSLKIWFKKVIQEHYFINDTIPDSVIDGKVHEHHMEA